MLALGVQGLAGIGNESDRIRIGPYVRWGITNKWALLAEANYSFFWDAGPPDPGGNQVVTYLQLFYHHYECLVSTVTINYAYTDFSLARSDLRVFPYTTTTRLHRHVTIGVTDPVGHLLRAPG